MNSTVDAVEGLEITSHHQGAAKLAMKAREDGIARHCAIGKRQNTVQRMPGTRLGEVSPPTWHRYCRPKSMPVIRKSQSCKGLGIFAYEVPQVLK